MERIDVGLNLLSPLIAGKVDAALGPFWNIEGVELQDEAASIAETRLPGRVFRHNIDHPSAFLADGSFDAITMMGLVEHVQRPDALLTRARALLKDGRWELSNAWVSAVGQETAFYEHYLVSTYLTPTQVRDSLGTVFSISFWDLPNFIQIAERAGLPATQYRVQYQLLLSRPFLLVTMVLIAATCSLRGFRFGNVQINAVLGLAAGFTFFVLSEVSRNFAMAGLTTAAAAAWVPVLIAASLALTVLLYKEDG